jgi:transposase
MNLRKYNTDPALLLEQGKAIMSSSDESKYLFRVFAVNMVLSGTPASQVGASAGYTKAAVTGWVKTVDEKGFEALRPQRRPGRPSKLTKEQMSEIDTVLQTDPKEHGFKVWDGPSLSSYIKSHYNVDMGVRQCQRLFHMLGFSHIRPQSHPSKGYEDTEERETFKKNGTRSQKTSH